MFSNGGAFMELDVKIETNSISINITNPFHLDMEDIIKKINEFAISNSADIDGLDIKGLIPKMVKGIAGCEGGCPANAKRLVENGFGNFKINYIEGGILSAEANTKNGKVLRLKMFSHF